MSEIKRVLQAVKEFGSGCTVIDVVAATGISQYNIGRYLAALARQGKIERTGKKVRYLNEKKDRVVYRTGPPCVEFIYKEKIGAKKVTST